MKTQIQEVQKMETITSLAGGIAHQFNNALVGITGNIELIKMDFPHDEKIDKYIAPMKASADRMAHLTEQLLAYARGGKYQPTIISLRNFMEEILPLVQCNIEPAIRLEKDLPDDIADIKADRTQIQMVFSGLVANASEAIEGPGLIKITVRNVQIEERFSTRHPDLKPGSYVYIEIEDDGKGMDDETKNRIFEPFFTTKFHGRGLGMAAAYGIINNHDGWISVDSVIGKGTVVRIYLPAVETRIEEMRHLKPGFVMGTGTILVVEDEEMVMDVSRAMLGKLGYHVLEALTGEEAVNIAKTFDGDIDFAILDVALPDMECTAVYSNLIGTRPNLKTIICSGYPIDGPVQEILDAGAQDFIQKPFSLKTLSEKLKNVLDDR
jgi:CheY-like chemotaxis protein